MKLNPKLFVFGSSLFSSILSRFGSSFSFPEFFPCSTVARPNVFLLVFLIPLLRKFRNGGQQSV
jgi:hypothetical protein